MREVIGILALFPFITWILTHKKYEDIAAPYNLFTMLYVINVMIPAILYINVDTAQIISENYIRNAVAILHTAHILFCKQCAIIL